MVAIGQEVSAMLRSAFGCRIFYNSRRWNSVVEVAHGIEFVSLDGLFESLGVVILLIPTALDKRHLVEGALFTWMRRGAVMVNSAGPHLWNRQRFGRRRETRTSVSQPLMDIGWSRFRMPSPTPWVC